MSSSSYLFDRKQLVMYNGYKSEAADIGYSVTQGSILGPLLFLSISYQRETFSILYDDDATRSHGKNVN